LEPTLNSAKPLTELKDVPASCSTDELLVAIKAAMFEVSNWLVEVERINRRRQSAMDKDLESIVNDTLAADMNNLEMEDNDEGDNELASPPPSYSELLGSEEVRNELEDEEFAVSAFQEVQSPPVPPFQKTANGLYHGTKQYEQEEVLTENRTQLIYDALVDQRNNNARWLGSNSKLTRLKFYGGLSTLLKLQVEWPQFDTLWTKLDSKRSGDLDIHEFKKYFNLDTEGSDSVLSGNMDEDAQKELRKCLFQLCDQLRHAGFTLKEMFAGFDRNASNEISVSEFCSLLKLALSGVVVDKKLIYHALFSVDTDGSKSVSLEELSRMVYGVWRTQLDQLADKLSRIAESGGGSRNEKEVTAAVLRERDAIKEAIKRNFTRPQRDRLEAETRSPHLHGLTGPFQTLLGRLGLGGDHTGTATATNEGDFHTQPQSSYHTPHSPGTSRPSRSNRWSRTAGSSQRANQMGQNQIKRFTIKLPSSPSRPGTVLSLPPAQLLNNDTLLRGHTTAMLLQNN